MTGERQRHIGLGVSREWETTNQHSGYRYRGMPREVRRTYTHMDIGDHLHPLGNTSSTSPYYVSIKLLVNEDESYEIKKF